MPKKITEKSYWPTLTDHGHHHEGRERLSVNATETSL